MIGKRNVTGFTFCHVATFLTDDRLRISPTVQKQNCLFVCGKTFFKLVFQRHGKRGIVPPAHFPSHIRDGNFRHRLFVNTLFKSNERKLSFLCPFIRFYGRGCATQNQLTTVFLGAKEGNVKGVVTGGGFQAVLECSG